MNTGLTVTCISANKKQTTFASFTKFGNKYWTDCAGNKSKPGYYFAFYDKKDKVYIHKIHNILSPTEQPADMDWKPKKPNKKNILCFGKRLMTIPWEEWKNGIGKDAPYTVGNYRMNQTTTCPGFDCTRFIYAESAIKEDEEDEEEALILRRRKERQAIQDKEDEELIKIARAKKMRKDIDPIRQTEIDSLNKDIAREEAEIEKRKATIMELRIEIEAVKSGTRDEELIRRATLTPK